MLAEQIRVPEHEDTKTQTHRNVAVQKPAAKETVISSAMTSPSSGA